MNFKNLNLHSTVLYLFIKFFLFIVNYNIYNIWL